MNNKLSLEEYIINYTPDLSPQWFIINLVLTALLAHLLGRIYTKFGNSLSNRRSFASNFELIALTTMLIITIVKSSLALSLGLVGALSIVRFRAAIKEPEELSYIFFNIALGLGFGANQSIITTLGFVFVVAVLWLKNKQKNNIAATNLNFTVITEQPTEATLDKIVNLISPFCKGLEIKRLDERKDFMEVSFLVEFSDFNQLNQAKDTLRGLDESIQISFLDFKGVV